MLIKPKIDMTGIERAIVPVITERNNTENR